MWFFGMVFIAFGLIVAIDATPFANMWGYGTANGVIDFIVGAILVLAAVLSPLFFSRREVVSSEFLQEDQVPVVEVLDRRPVGQVVYRRDRAL
jgi:hypothetical protein